MSPVNHSLPIMIPIPHCGLHPISVTLWVHEVTGSGCFPPSSTLMGWMRGTSSLVSRPKLASNFAMPQSVSVSKVLRKRQQKSKVMRQRQINWMLAFWQALFSSVQCGICLHICSPLGVRLPRRSVDTPQTMSAAAIALFIVSHHCATRERKRDPRDGGREGGCLLLSSSAFFSFGPKSSSSFADAVAE